MDSMYQVQFLDEAISISLLVNPLEKDMSPTIFPTAIGKIVKQARLSSICRSTNLGKDYK